MRLQRLVAILAWVIGAFIFWPMLLLLGLRLLTLVRLQYDKDSPSHQLPQWAAVVFIYGIFGGGTMLAALSALALGWRGKLLGTRRCHPKHKGSFSIE
jgi:hypothetical protein